ncbi:DNA polymerase IV [Alishewanella tabrizica]|uniref:DNA polymerase IV n=1 Tax=Alishewanella tabrizica TaxID=671278 RepID=A0ABQ2WGT5_9ALTE|nr:DNA polymerase IV [Alishewanella tabrizica]GGW50617.1 DNA polymerase IV [Alishewanella tabrizica]
MTTHRKIIHLDMDCFFAAVEMRDNPALKTVPLAIGGSRNERGVIATCNYPARAFGVRSAMPTHEALKRCPHLTLLRGNMEKYKTLSRQIQAIFLRYTDLVEPLSLDEAYLDVSNCSLFRGSATLIAEDIRRTVLLETGLTVSAGVAPNKFLAKIASDENKPDGLFVLPPHHVPAFIETLPLRRIPGVGQKTSEKLAALGLTLCRDIVANGQEPSTQMLSLLVKHLGSLASSLLQRCQGIDERPVQPSRERKSIGVEHTLAHDLHDLAQVQDALLSLLPTLEQRLLQSGKTALLHKIGVKLKFSDFRQTTVETQCSQLNPLLFQQLLEQAWQRRQEKTVRLIGLHLGFRPVCEEQLLLPLTPQ